MTITHPSLTRTCIACGLQIAFRFTETGTQQWFHIDDSTAFERGCSDPWLSK